MIAGIYNAFHVLLGCLIFTIFFLYFTYYWFDMAQHRPQHWLSRMMAGLRNLSINLRMNTKQGGSNMVIALARSLGRIGDLLTNYDFVLMFKRMGLALKMAAIRLNKLFFENRNDGQQR